MRYTLLRLVASFLFYVMSSFGLMAIFLLIDVSDGIKLTEAVVYTELKRAFLIMLLPHLASVYLWNRAIGKSKEQKKEE